MVRDTTVDSGCGDASFPLSPLQQGMLFHRLEGAGRGVDVEQVICELRHPVNAPHFELAWNMMLQRHEALRTSFQCPAGGAPRQVVTPASETTLNLRVLECGSPADAEHVLQEYLALDRRAGFAALTAPLIRVALLRGAEDHCWCVCTYHHLVLDSRATRTLFREVFDVHDALERGERPELPPVRPYRDFISWQQSLSAAPAEAFWRAQLAGLATATALPLPYPTAAIGNDAAPGELVMKLTEAETDRLRLAAARHEVTLNTLMQGAWAVVLGRYTGESDVVFGAVRACRHVPVEGAAELVGLFINTVPVRVRMPDTATVGDWLRGLRAQWVAMREFEHASLLKVQQWAEIAPGQPLFDTLYNFQEPAWHETLTAQGGRWSRRRFEMRDQPNYPLAIDIAAGATVRVRAIYHRHRFAAEAIERLLGHYRMVLDALAGDRRVTLGEVPLLTSAEERRLLVEWNRTTAEYPRSACTHLFVEARAEETPERIAVADARTTLTYGELNARANRLGHRLKSLGVGPGVLVAVCMERSVEMVMAWLAVMKAGGAFVPLDPGYPTERLQFQLRDSAAPVLLTTPASRVASVPPGVIQLEVRVDDISGHEPTGNVAHTATARDLAYVIYTSGSTGQPKGVEIEHRSLLNLVTWHQRTYAITPADRATHLASPAFDASVWEIWPYLAAGASVHIPDDETRIAPAKLWAWLAAEKITLAFLPTPLAEAAMAETWLADMALRALLTGGDKLQRPTPENFPCALINHYGPTENTVVATAALVPPGSVGVPPIGRPIANSKVFVLDRALRPVPIGVPGELFIGGEGLARGYWQRPELTAEKFIPNPFASPGEESRLYRTGDLVRWNEDGALEFIGRIDGQVKIRGCRIELGEIEATLQRQPGVREAVVLVRPDAQEQPQLVAYVLRGAEAVTAEAITAAMQAALPRYMVPAHVVLLDAWPLTPNGKIDRRALPIPAAAAEATSFMPPSTANEQAIAHVWQELLGRERVGQGDNFFSLGGHSLLAAQAVTRLNAALGVTLSVRTIFDHPTVGELAREVDARRVAGATPRLPVLRAKRRTSRPDLEVVQPR